MKKSTKMSNNLKLAAVFVAGLAVATLGWWQSDRLNLAFGASLGINEIAGGDQSIGVKNCNPTDKREVSRKIDGCTVAVSQTTCVTKRDYVSVEKTRTGKRLVINSSPSRSSIERVSYDKVESKAKSEVKTEYDKTSKEIENLKKTKTVAELAKDNDYQSSMKYKKELELMVNSCAKDQVPGKAVRPDSMLKPKAN